MLPIMAPNTENITSAEIAAAPPSPSTTAAASAATRVEASTLSTGRM